MVRRVHSALTLLSAAVVICRPAFADLSTNLNSNLFQESMSSVLSLTASKSLGMFEFSGEATGEVTSNYQNVKSTSDSEQISAMIVAKTKFQPSLSVSATNSVKDKTNVLAANSGVSFPLLQSSQNVTWTTSGSLRRIALKLKPATSTSTSTKKSAKQSNPYLLQYGLGQTISWQNTKNHSASIFYQNYFYNLNVAEASAELNKSINFSNKKKSASKIADTLSTFADHTVGFSASLDLMETISVKTDYVRTQLKLDNSISEVIIPKLSYQINESLESYLEAELNPSLPSSQTWTAAVSNDFSESFNSEFGIILGNTSTEQSWGVLISLSYLVESQPAPSTAGSQNQ